MFVCGVDLCDLSNIEEEASKSLYLEKFSTFAEYIKSAIDRLAAEKQEVEARSRTIDKSRKRLADLAPESYSEISAAFRETRSKLGERYKIIGQRIIALEHFKEDLERCRQDGALKFLMTRHRCPKCENERHKVKDYCSNDVLFFNIDIKLLRALKRFRETYFAVDTFLPLPFRLSEKRKIFGRISTKADERAGKLARAREIAQRGSAQSR
jgi:hypothetical protein